MGGRPRRKRPEHRELQRPDHSRPPVINSEIKRAMVRTPPQACGDECPPRGSKRLIHKTRHTHNREERVMLLKAVKWGVIGVGGLTLAGAVVFGRDMCSYATS